MCHSCYRATYKIHYWVFYFLTSSEDGQLKGIADCSLKYGLINLCLIHHKCWDRYPHPHPHWLVYGSLGEHNSYPKSFLHRALSFVRSKIVQHIKYLCWMVLESVVLRFLTIICPKKFWPERKKYGFKIIWVHVSRLPMLHPDRD